MKIHVDTLDSRIETDNPDLMKALYELYSFKVPGAEYSGAYKRRHWDGKTHFISKQGVFKTGLLSRIIKDLKKIDCTPEISVSPTWDKPVDNPRLKGFIFYKYQEKSYY